MAHAINLNAEAAYVERPGLFACLRQSFADYREYLATYAELSALSDHQLADIGLSRLNIRGKLAACRRHRGRSSSWCARTRVSVGPGAP